MPTVLTTKERREKTMIRLIELQSHITNTLYLNDAFSLTSFANSELQITLSGIRRVINDFDGNTKRLLRVK